MTEYAFLEMALTESYDFETFDGFRTFCDPRDADVRVAFR